MDDYYTHQKYLKKELDSVPKKSFILELGIGEGSCPLMYEFCKNNPNSTVISFESDASWFDQMCKKYGDLPNYIFKFIENWDDLINHIDQKKYNLVFVDQSPWEARINSINLLKDKVNVFILHDYDYFNDNGSGTPIVVNDQSSWLGKTYSEDFILEDNYEVFPPTLIMRKK